MSQEDEDLEIAHGICSTEEGKYLQEPLLNNQQPATEEKMSRSGEFTPL